MSVFKNARIVCNAPLPRVYQQETGSRGTREFTVSSHSLMEFLRNANRWRNGYVSPDSKAKEFGDYFDCLRLVPEQWSKRFAIPPATYTNKDGEQKKWRDDERIAEVKAWKEANKDKDVVDHATNNQVHAAIAAIDADERAKSILDSGVNQVWLSATYVDAATGLEIPIKGLVDIVPATDHPIHSDCLADLKTTRNASPYQFMKDVYKFHYHVQAALYLDLWSAATNNVRSQFIHVVIESFYPYECRCPMLSGRFIEAGRFIYRSALVKYARALRDDIWPGYDKTENWPVTEPEDWMVNEAMNSAPELEYSDDDDKEEQFADVIP